MQIRPVGQRPTVALEPTDHPLAVEQREAISVAGVREIALQLLHPDLVAHSHEPANYPVRMLDLLVKIAVVAVIAGATPHEPQRLSGLSHKVGRRRRRSTSRPVSGHRLRARPRPPDGDGLRARRPPLRDRGRRRRRGTGPGSKVPKLFHGGLKKPLGLVWKDKTLSSRSRGAWRRSARGAADGIVVGTCPFGRHQQDAVVAGRDGRLDFGSRLHVRRLHREEPPQCHDPLRSSRSGERPPHRRARAPQPVRPRRRPAHRQALRLRQRPGRARRQRARRDRRRRPPGRELRLAALLGQLGLAPASRARAPA